MNPQQQHVRSEATWPAGRAEPTSTQIPELIARWDRIQAGFVDDPARALAEAEQLVNQVMTQARECLERESSEINSTGRAQGASTEDLRQCMKRYRMLVDRLLPMIC